LFINIFHGNELYRVVKIALFDKALVLALAPRSVGAGCGALAMCRMCDGRISKFLCGGLKN